jgi:hypothetical protein
LTAAETQKGKGNCLIFSQINTLGIRIGLTASFRCEPKDKLLPAKSLSDSENLPMQVQLQQPLEQR